MDTFVLNALVRELQQSVCPARINSICQPDDFSLVLVLWHQGKEYRLAMSASSNYQYLFLTPEPPENRVAAFGKFLHYHIKSGEIRAIRKPLLERIVTFEIVKEDIDGQPLDFQLIFEIMGRYSNLILVQRDTQKILDSLRHVTAAQTSYRRIAPGAVYAPPPPQQKIDPTQMTKEMFLRLLQEYEQEAAHTPFWKFLLQQVQGFSPLLAKELDAETDADAKWRRFSAMIEILDSGAYQPTVIFNRREPKTSKSIILSAIPLESFAQRADMEICPYASMNEAVEMYYRTEIERQQAENIKISLLSSLNARLSKLLKKQEHLRTQHAEIENAEQYKHKGELLTANMAQLKRGMASVDVVDYYREDQALINIELDPKYSPSQNVQRYFKRYNKLKQGKEITAQRLQETDQAIAYLEELKFFVEDAESYERLKELHEDMNEKTPSKAPRKANQKQAVEPPAQPFLRFVSSDGFEIYVGRSSKENDQLTMRTAQPDDLWLHVHNAPGSHVVILNRQRNVSVPKSTITEAASLAAYHSKLRNSRSVDVNYTEKKYVKKPKGSPPGLVTLSQFKTIRVMPKAEITAPRVEQG